MMKKIFVLFIAVSLMALTISGCNGGNGFTPPSGNEGEGEGEVETQVVLVELFIQEGCPNCAIIEPYLESMAANDYSKDEMILVELAPYGIYSNQEALDRYKWYLPNTSDRSTPNTLFNGMRDRIYGSSSYSSFKTRIDAQLNSTPTIHLEATRKTTAEGTVITGKVKNISDTELTGLAVNGMVFKNRNKSGFRYSVTDIFEDEKYYISSLAPGEVTNFSINIEGLNWDGQGLNGVVFVQSIHHAKKIIRQSLYIK